MTNFLKKSLHYSNFKISNKGMTLVELLVVLLIIGILVTISCFFYFRQIDKSKEIQARLNIEYSLKLQRAYYHEVNSFTDSIKALGCGSQNRKENYFYKIMLLPPDELTIAAHLALSKKPNLSSYVGALYLENNDVKTCNPFPTPDAPILVRYPMTDQKLVDLYYSRSRSDWASFCK